MLQLQPECMSPEMIWRWKVRGERGERGLVEGESREGERGREGENCYSEIGLPGVLIR